MRRLLADLSRPTRVWFAQTRDRWHCRLPGPARAALAGRKVLVTGAAGGIGAALVRQLLEHGAIVLAHTRHPDRAAGSLAQQARSHPDRLSLHHADLSDRAEVAAMIDRIRQQHEHLDALCNNAALGYEPIRRRDSLGLEAVWSVNVVAPRQLAAGLEPLLRRGRMPRVVNVVSSFLHDLKPNVLDEVAAADPGPADWDPAHAYARSKQALLALTAESAGNGPIRYLAIDPGTVDTTMAAGFPWPLQGVPVGQAATLLARMIADPALQDDPTVFFRVGRRSKLPAQAADAAWRRSLVGAVDR